MKERWYIIVISSREAGDSEGQATTRHLPIILAVSWGVVTADLAVNSHTGLWLSYDIDMGRT